MLDRALDILPAKDGKRFSSLVSWGKLNPTRHIAESLEAAGVVRIHTGGPFGSLHPSYPTLDPVPERQLRARIDAALRGVQPSTASDVALLSILQALSVAPTVLPQQETGLSRGELKRRIQEISGESPVGRGAAGRGGRDDSHRGGRERWGSGLVQLIRGRVPAPPSRAFLA